MTIEEAQADIAYLLGRAIQAGYCNFSDLDREVGISSNAIVRLAYGGRAPDKSEMPSDASDLSACERAVAKLPPHRMSCDVREALENGRRAVRERYP